MKNFEQIIAQKQAEIQRLRNEIAALKIVMPLLAETAPAAENARPLPPALTSSQRVVKLSAAPVRLKQPINVVRRISLQT